MKAQTRLLWVMALILMAGLAAFFLRPLRKDAVPPDKAVVVPVSREQGTGRASVAAASDGKGIPIPGVGEIPYATKHLSFPTSDWFRKIMHRMPDDQAQREESLKSRDANKEWARTDVYYGKNGEILHIDVNKGEFPSVPMDEQAIARMRDEQGLRIVRTGFPEGLLKSGYTMEDFLLDTYTYWDRGIGGGHEYGITPVIVEVTAVEGPKVAIRDQSFLGKEVPMILVKDGTYVTTEDFRGSSKDPLYDSYDDKEVCRRTWTLEEYARVKSGNPPAVPHGGGGERIFEPLLEAWNKRQKGTGNNGQ